MIFGLRYSEKNIYVKYIVYSKKNLHVKYIVYSEKKKNTSSHKQYTHRVKKNWRLGKQKVNQDSKLVTI